MQYKTECAPVIYIDDNISDEDMADIFKASKVVVHPYRAEGFGMHIQEAVACGCVPILPDTGPHQDLWCPVNVAGSTGGCKAVSGKCNQLECCAHV